MNTANKGTELTQNLSLSMNFPFYQNSCFYVVYNIGQSDAGGPDIRSDSDRDSEAGSNGVTREGSSVDIPQSMLRELITGFSAEVDQRSHRSGRRIARKSKEKEYKLLSLGNSSYSVFRAIR